MQATGEIFGDECDIVKNNETQGKLRIPETQQNIVTMFHLKIQFWASWIKGEHEFMLMKEVNFTGM